MKKVTDKQIEAQLDNAKKFTPEDLEQTVKKEKTATSIAKRFSADVFRKVKLTAGLLKDYCKGNYREVPWNTIASLGFGIAYLVSPIDLIPDVIPFLGYTDDLALLGFIFRGFSQDLEEYAQWKTAHG